MGSWTILIHLRLLSLMHLSYEYGHRKSDCPNERVIKCRNCEEVGHVSRECPKPTDWSKVQCRNCKVYGHTVKRCPEPVFENTSGFSGGGSDNGTGVGASGSWNTGGGTVAAEGNWAEVSADINIDTAGGSDDHWGSTESGVAW
jgi:cellular nucleic acid-binding protein